MNLIRPLLEEETVTFGTVMLQIQLTSRKTSLEVGANKLSNTNMFSLYIFRKSITICNQSFQVKRMKSMVGYVCFDPVHNTALSDEPDWFIGLMGLLIEKSNSARYCSMSQLLLGILVGFGIVGHKYLIRQALNLIHTG